MARPLLLALLLAGCVSYQTALVGPGPGALTTVWDARGGHLAQEMQGSAATTLTRARAIELGLGETWALVDYQDVTDAGAYPGTIGVRDVHRVDGTARFADLSRAIEVASSLHGLAVAAHGPETEAAMRALGVDPTPTGATDVTTASFDGTRVRITLRTSFVRMEMQRPCGGAPAPDVPTILGGIAWHRDYDIARDATVTAIGDLTRTSVPGPPYCDPRLP